MTVNLSALAGAGQQFFDNNGNLLAGGKLYSYVAGTTTPQVTYTSASGATAHTNPIVLDSAGRIATGEIWLTAGQNYKFLLKTSSETTLATWDNITGINGTGITTNASSVEYNPPFTGAVISGYTVQDKLKQTVSVKDFGAVGNGIVDDTAAIQLAINSASSYGSIYIPSGIYKITSTLTIDVGIILYGDGAQEYADAIPGKTVLQYTGTGPAIRIIGTGPEGKENIHLSSFSILGTASADGGILIGTALITKSSFKNLFISNFTNSGTELGYGIKILNLYTSGFENIYTHKNRDGINFEGLSTTLNFLNCISRLNNRDGVRVRNGSHNIFINFILESNYGYGLNLIPDAGKAVVSWDLYSIYTENNSNKGTPTAQINQTAININGGATGNVFSINFYGGSIVEPGGATKQAIVLDKCSAVWFYRTTVNSNNQDVIKVDPVNTTFSGFQSYAANFNNVTDDSINSVTGLANFQYIGQGIQGPIVFNATQQNASDPYVLDDYRELAFTPVFADALTGGNVASATEVYGSYTKIGNVITVSLGASSINTTGLVAGQKLYIRNLPFSATYPVFASMQAIAASTTQPIAKLYSGTYFVIGVTIGGVSRDALVSDVISGATNFFLTITYITN